MAENVAARTEIQAGDAAVPEKFTSFAQVTSISGPSFSHGVVDVTDLSDDWKQFLKDGSADGGEITVGVNLDPDPAGIHDTLLDRAIASAVTNFALCWPNLTDNNFAFLAADVNVGADTITEVGHGLHTGQPVRVGTDDTMPPPLAVDTTYYVIYTTANTFQLALTNADAVAGVAVPINITGQGIGNHALYYGNKETFAAAITGGEPTGSLYGAVTGTITMKVTGTITSA